jgi:hypothetical protein
MKITQVLATIALSFFCYGSVHAFGGIARLDPNAVCTGKGNTLKCHGGVGISKITYVYKQGQKFGILKNFVKALNEKKHKDLKNYGISVKLEKDNVWNPSLTYEFVKKLKTKVYLNSKSIRFDSTFYVLEAGAGSEICEEELYLATIDQFEVLKNQDDKTVIQLRATEVPEDEILETLNKYFPAVVEKIDQCPSK